MLEVLTRQLDALQPLTETQICQAVEQLIDEALPVSVKADFLSNLARKGETGAEIAFFARELRARAIFPSINGTLRSREILDVVGTGGDRLSTFNISTAAALVAAAAGVLVAKHGNRASTSSIGSADVIEALGIRCDLGPEDAVRSLEQHGFAFFFAPKYHPVFRHIIPARKLCAERGQSTIFNMLGPLLNPALPSAMLVGVPRPVLCEPMALVLQQLGARRAMVVCGTAPDETGTLRHLDEISPLGPSSIAEFYQQHALTSSTLLPESFPLQPARLADLRGGDRATNASIILRIFEGQDRGPRRDAVLLNAAAALFVAGAVRSMAEGWDLAGSVINRGRRPENSTICGGLRTAISWPVGRPAAYVVTNLGRAGLYRRKVAMYRIIGIDGQQYGPVSADQLRRWLAESRVNAQTLVQLEGTQDWKPLVSFTEFLSDIKVQPALTSMPPSLVTVHPRAGSKIAAGICGILLGSLGIHKFILGYTGAGLIMLLVTVLTCFIASPIMHLIGLIEGIIYLTKSDTDFVKTYVDGRREWF